MKSTGMIKACLNGNKNYRSVRYLCLSLLLLVGLTTLCVSPLWALNEGPNIPISVENGGAEPPFLLSGDQQNPTIIALPDKNKWFVVWEDWRNFSTTGADIYGRFINGDGTLCGNEIAISTQLGNQTVPVLSYRNRPDSNPKTVGVDKIMIAWQDTRGGYLSGFLYYDILDISLLADDCLSGFTFKSDQDTNPATKPTGFAIGYKRIGFDKLQSRTLPDIAYDNTRDQFWLVWIESRNQLQRLEERPFGVYGIPKWNFADSNYIAFTTVSAAAEWAEVPEILRNTVGSSSRTVRLISSTSEFEDDGGTVIYNYEYFTGINNVNVACDDSSPEALIAWEGIRGKATLTCDWEEKDEETLEECYYVDDGAGGYELVCIDVPNPDYGVPTKYDAYSSELKTEYESGGTADGLVHIYAIFDKYITQPVVSSQLVDSSDAASYYPALAYDTIHRKFLVAWEDRGSAVGDGVHSNVFGQLLYSGGGLYGSNFSISYQDLDGDGLLDDDIKSTNQTRPDIGIDSANQRFFVTWQDGRNSDVSVKIDIYGQFVDSEGSLQDNNYAVCLAPANQYNPATAFNLASHQFLTVWKDARNLNTTNSDIYAQRLSLGQSQLVLLDVEGARLTPALLDFALVKEDQVEILSFTVRNIGDVAIQIDALTPLLKPFSYWNLPPELALVGDGLAIDLMPGSSFMLGIQFAPNNPGVFFDDFTTISNSTDLTVTLQGQGINKDIYLAPATIDFPDSEIGDRTVRNVVVYNNSDQDIQVKSVSTGTDDYSVSGIAVGDIISVGSTLTCQVTFKPATAGYIEDRLYMNLGLVQPDPTPFEEIDMGTQYVVVLRGLANADFVFADIDSYTADSAYQLSISASTSQSGQLYLIFSHDPLSLGEIYALAQDGTLQPFPYMQSSGWQNLWYKNGAYPGMKIDLSQIDFRSLGCSDCQGEKVDAGGGVSIGPFGIITPPDDTPFNNASDFKYMNGTLYMGSYIKEAPGSVPFDFNKGLLEMQSLIIHSLNGTWKVTSSYYGVDRVHSSHLVVTEPGDGNISAIWPGYDVTMIYGEGESGYVMTFNMEVYEYTYKITAMTEDTFTGTYTCIADGVVIAEGEPVSGVRLK